MKVLFSDLDGTLIFNNEIKVSDKIAIKKFQEAGNKFAFCTGRGLAAVLDLLDVLKPDYLSLNSGALLLDGATEEIYTKTISYKTADYVMKELSVVPTTAIVIYTVKNMYLIGEIPYNYDAFPIIKSLDEIDEDIAGLGCLFKNKNDAYIATENLKKHSNGEYEVFQNEASLDVVATGCSKGNSIIKFAEILKLDLNDIYCIGDSYNDLTMFESIENSFTFNYSDQPIKEATKYLVDSVAEAIEIINKES